MLTQYKLTLLIRTKLHASKDEVPDKKITIHNNSNTVCVDSLDVELSALLCGDTFPGLLFKALKAPNKSSWDISSFDFSEINVKKTK